MRRTCVQDPRTATSGTAWPRYPAGALRSASTWAAGGSASTMATGSNAVAQPKQLEVLVYNGEGAGYHSARNLLTALRHHLVPEVQARFLGTEELLSGSWCDSCLLLVMPGGADLPYCKHLNGRGNRLLRAYVEGGGSYLGICAGAYYATRRVEFELGTPLEVVGDRELGFFPGAARGAAYPGFDYRSERGAHAAPLRFRPLCLPTEGAPPPSAPPAPPAAKAGCAAAAASGHHGIRGAGSRLGAHHLVLTPPLPLLGGGVVAPGSGGDAAAVEEAEGEGGEEEAAGPLLGAPAAAAEAAEEAAVAAAPTFPHMLSGHARREDGSGSCVPPCTGSGGGGSGDGDGRGVGGTTSGSGPASASAQGHGDADRTPVVGPGADDGAVAGGHERHFRMPGTADAAGGGASGSSGGSSSSGGGGGDCSGSAGGGGGHYDGWVYCRDYCNGGPVFVPAAADGGGGLGGGGGGSMASSSGGSSGGSGAGDVEVLAVYPELADGLAAVRCRVGSGVAVLCSTHPEMPHEVLAGAVHMYDSEQAQHIAALAAALAAWERQRRRFWVALLLACCTAPAAAAASTPAEGAAAAEVEEEEQGSERLLGSVVQIGREVVAAGLGAR